MPIALASVALVLAVLAVVFAGLALWRTASMRRRSASTDLPEDVLGLRQEVAALKADSAQALRHLAVVRYDAYGDMGGHLSWSLALLDDAGDGVVMTSIASRSEARTYAKSVAGWSSEQQLSAEEDEAITHARP